MVKAKPSRKKRPKTISIVKERGTDTKKEYLAKCEQALARCRNIIGDDALSQMAAALATNGVDRFLCWTGVYEALGGVFGSDYAEDYRDVAKGVLETYRVQISKPKVSQMLVKTDPPGSVPDIKQAFNNTTTGRKKAFNGSPRVDRRVASHLG